MRKFFDSKTAKVKNPIIAKIINAFAGWVFFIVACCATFLLCFYSSDENDTVYGTAAELMNITVNFHDVDDSASKSCTDFCENLYLESDNGSVTKLSNDGKATINMENNLNIKAEGIKQECVKIGLKSKYDSYEMLVNQPVGMYKENDKNIGIFKNIIKDKIWLDSDEIIIDMYYCNGENTDDRLCFNLDFPEEDSSKYDVKIFDCYFTKAEGDSTWVSNSRAGNLSEFKKPRALYAPKYTHDLSKGLPTKYICSLAKFPNSLEATLQDDQNKKFQVAYGFCIDLCPVKTDDKNSCDICLLNEDEDFGLYYVKIGEKKVKCYGKVVSGDEDSKFKRFEFVICNDEDDFSSGIFNMNKNQTVDVQFCKVRTNDNIFFVQKKREENASLLDKCEIYMDFKNPEDGHFSDSPFGDDEKLRSSVKKLTPEDGYSCLGYKPELADLDKNLRIYVEPKEEYKDGKFEASYDVNYKKGEIETFSSQRAENTAQKINDYFVMDVQNPDFEETSYLVQVQAGDSTEYTLTLKGNTVESDDGSKYTIDLLGRIKDVELHYYYVDSNNKKHDAKTSFSADEVNKVYTVKVNDSMQGLYIKFKSGDGYYMILKDGDNNSVKIKKEGDASSPIKCTLNNSELKTTGIITVDKDTTLIVENILIKQCKVGFTVNKKDVDENDKLKDIMTGVTIYDIAHELESDNKVSVNYGTPLSEIKVNLTDKYNKSNNLSLTLESSDGTTITDTTITADDTEITITGLKVNSYNLRIKNLSKEKEGSAANKEIPYISEMSKIARKLKDGSEDLSYNYSLDYQDSPLPIHSKDNIVSHGEGFTLTITLNKWFRFVDNDDKKKLISNSVGCDESNYTINVTGADTAEITFTGVVNDITITLNNSVVHGDNYDLQFYSTSKDISTYKDGGLEITKLEFEPENASYKKIDKSADKDGNIKEIQFVTAPQYYLVALDETKYVFGDGGLSVSSNVPKGMKEGDPKVIDKGKVTTINETTNETTETINIAEKSNYRIVSFTLDQTLEEKSITIYLKNIFSAEKYVAISYEKDHIKEIECDNFKQNEASLSKEKFSKSIKLLKIDKNGVEEEKKPVSLAKVPYSTKKFEITVNTNEGHRFEGAEAVNDYVKFYNKISQERGENNDLYYKANIVEKPVDPEVVGATVRFDQLEQDADGGKKRMIITFENGLNENLFIEVTSNPQIIPIYFTQTVGLEYYSVKTTDRGTQEPDTQVQGMITVSSGDSYEFAVKPTKGYDINKLEIYKDQIKLDSTYPGGDYKIYKIENITNSASISGTIESIKCKIKFIAPSGDEVGDDKDDLGKNIVTYIQNGTTIGESTNISYGEHFTFQVNLGEKYNQSKFEVRVCKLSEYEEYEKGENDRQLISNGSDYTIYDVRENLCVYVKGISVNIYTVNFLPSDNVEYLLDENSSSSVNSGIINVKYAKNCEFRIKAKTGYKLDDSTVVNCVSDTDNTSLTKIETSSSSGESPIYKYTITEIKENKIVSVENVENLTYTVKFENVEGVTYVNDTGVVISGNQKVKYGHNFEFGVNVDDEYDDSAAGMFIIINDGKTAGVYAQKLSSGRYIIPNITRDIRIKVGNIRKNRFTVTLTKTEGIDYYNEKGKIITGDNEAAQNENFKFKVSLYTAYKNSEITVMLGDKELSLDSSGFYIITGIDENKTVTVLGVEKTKAAKLVNTISTLPEFVDSLDDANAVIEASRTYNSLSDAEKSEVANFDVLEELQEQVKAFHHTSNDVTVEGLDWYLKLMVIPISSEMDACTRIYKKLNSEYIISLYDVYLWDTLKDRKYSLPKNKKISVSIPAPDLKYFEKPTGIHENSDGKIDFLSLTFQNDRVIFEATSFSPMGIIANRSSTPGRSSLLDAVDANVDLIKDFALSNFGGDFSNKSGPDSASSSVFDDTGDGSEIGGGEKIEGNISEKYKSRNNRVTFQGSALRLILVLMILILLALAIWIIYKKRKEKNKKSTSA